jgi:hypothetical protein
MNKSDLNQFIGTEQYYRHPSGLQYTDGIKYLAEKAGAYWLIDLIASYQPRLEGFQLWQLEVSENVGIIACRADSGLPALVSQTIEYTDFPFDIDVYVCDGVLLLPSEY